MKPLNLLKPQLYKNTYFFNSQGNSLVHFYLQIRCNSSFSIQFLYIYFLSLFWLLVLCICIMFKCFILLVQAPCILKKRCYVNKNSCFICTL